MGGWAGGLRSAWPPRFWFSRLPLSVLHHLPIRPSAHPGDALTVSLVTMGVGVRVWERFGHNAILIEDRARGTRTAYNYGLFDFRQEDFLLRFIQGRMWYWMQGLDADAMLRSYIRDNRSVWVQELDLSPDGARRPAGFPRLERASGEPLLPLRLLPGQLLHAGPRRARPGAGRPAPRADRHRGHRHDLSVPHEAAYRDGHPALHRPRRRARPAGGPADQRLGGDVPAALGPRVGCGG